MMPENKEYYYEQKLPELMKEYEKRQAQLALEFIPYFDQSKIEELLEQVRDEVEALLLELPYIGGDANVLTRFLVDGAYSLPLLLALEREGISLRDMAKVLYRVNEAVNQLDPPEKRQQLGEFYFSEQMINILKLASKTSQMRKYPEDWVCDFIEGDGQSFDYGYNIAECGLMKYYKQHKAERFVPILCLTDYASYGVLGVGFRRTRKLATGDSLCDFQFKKDHKTPRGWPPEDLEEKFPFSETE